MALISKEDYKLHRNLTVTTWDDLIDSKIQSAEYIAAQETGRTFLAGSFSEYFDGNGSPTLVLTNSPIDSVSAVVLLSADGSEWEYDADDYTIDLSSGVLKLRCGGIARLVRDDFGVPETRFGWANGFPKGHQNIRVDYDGNQWGLGSEGDIPPDLKEALLAIMDYLLNDVIFPRTEPTDEDRSPGRTFYRTKYRDLLKRYKRIVIG